MENNATLSEDWMGFSDRSSVAKKFGGGWVGVPYMENNATLSEEWIGFSDRSSVAKIIQKMSPLSKKLSKLRKFL